MVYLYVNPIIMVVSNYMYIRNIGDKDGMASGTPLLEPFNNSKDNGMCGVDLRNG